MQQGCKLSSSPAGLGMGCDVREGTKKLRRTCLSSQPRFWDHAGWNLLFVFYGYSQWAMWLVARLWRYPISSQLEIRIRGYHTIAFIVPVP
jgi:hypothetical protein